MTTCTYDQLKQRAREFLMALPTLDHDQAENGLKCFNISYLECECDRAEQVMAVALVKYVNKKYLQKEMPL